MSSGYSDSEVENSQVKSSFRSLKVTVTRSARGALPALGPPGDKHRKVISSRSSTGHHLSRRDEADSLEWSVRREQRQFQHGSVRGLLPAADRPQGTTALYSQHISSGFPRPGPQGSPPGRCSGNLTCPCRPWPDHSPASPSQEITVDPANLFS